MLGQDVDPSDQAGSATSLAFDQASTFDPSAQPGSAEWEAASLVVQAPDGSVVLPAGPRPALGFLDGLKAKWAGLSQGQKVGVGVVAGLVIYFGFVRK